jgi:hypothetical protein
MREKQHQSVAIGIEYSSKKDPRMWMKYYYRKSSSSKTFMSLKLIKIFRKLLIDNTHTRILLIIYLRNIRIISFGL